MLLNRALQQWRVRKAAKYLRTGECILDELPDLVRQVRRLG